MKRLRWIFVPIVIVAVILLAMQTIKQSQKLNITDFVIEGDLRTYTNSTACIIRNEKVVYASNEGFISPIVMDGERVAKGEAVATQYDEKTKQLLAKTEKADNELSKAIKATGDKDLLNSFDVRKLESVADSKIEDIILAERNGDYQSAISSEREIKYINREQINYVVNALPAGNALLSLKNKAENLRKQFLLSSNVIKSKEAGIVSYNVDGMEKKLLPFKWGKITSKTIQQFQNSESDNTTGKMIKLNQPALKVITGFVQYIACECTNEFAKEIKINDYREILINDVSLTLNGVLIYKHKEANGKSIVVFQLDQGIEKTCYLRKADIDIANQETPQSGLKVPMSALYDIASDKGQGKIKLVRQGFAEEHRVNILQQNGVYAIIEEKIDTANKNEDEIMQERAKGVKVYDEYLISPDKYQNGSQIN